MSLLDRLLSACQTTCDCPNYADQPYLLQIDFLSNPVEANTFGISSHLIDRKRVAIKFNEFKIKPGINGTVYNVTARPYNHTAFDMSAASVPVNLSVEAKTVGEYFDSREELMRIFDQSATKDEERIESEILKSKGLYAATGSGNTEEDVRRRVEEAKASSFYSTKSYPAGFNTYYKNVAYQEGRTESPLYQILFNIHPDIANSPIIDTNKMDSKRTSMNDPKNQFKTTTAQGTDNNFKNKGVFMVNAGTDVVTLIDRVMASSQYIKNQIVAASQATTESDTNRSDTASQNDATKWYKVIPSVTLGLYDKVAQAYSKTIVYSIVPYNTGNFYHPDFKQTKINSKKCVRTYNYWYTGLNQDIVQFDIDFDATYATSITTFARQLENLNTSEGAEKINEKSIDAAARPDPKPSWLPKRRIVAPQDTQQTMNTGGSAENAVVGSVARSLYSNYPRGDMLNIRIRIVGDPSFIKQDDTLYQPTSQSYAGVVSTTSGSPPINQDGQIIFDNEEVYVQLIVKGTIDIDDTIGITNKTITLSNGQTTNGSFSGLYKVLIVTSEFSRGKFEQIVELIRVPDDLVEIDNAAGTSVTTNTNSITPITPSEEPTAILGPDNPLGSNIPTVDPGLIEAATGAVTNPIPGIQVQSRPFQDMQPTQAYPENINLTQFTI